MSLLIRQNMFTISFFILLSKFIFKSFMAAYLQHGYRHFSFPTEIAYH